jgi:hypothetical protein
VESSPNIQRSGAFMSESNNPRIVFSERLSAGIVVHFDDHVSVYFPSEFLYEQRQAQPNTVFIQDIGGDHPPHSEAVDDVRWGT